ncbi:hypothetical protein P8605_40030 [Streptomyces sp. T-3]|nr:hypothetical protein [Streptomyces sp. T-3]
MTQTRVPPQPGPLLDAPKPPGASEATRLLCAGTYLDRRYRDAVIEELYVREEHIVAPSLGFDAARVLAHALRSWRLDLGWAAAILLLWVVGLPLSEYLLITVLIPCVLLALAAAVRGTAPEPPSHRWAPALVLRWCGRIFLLLALWATLRTAFGADEGQSTASVSDGLLPEEATSVLVDAGGGEIKTFHAWVVIVVLLLVAGCVAGQRGQFARALAGELHLSRFADMAADPAESAQGDRFQRLRTRIRLEQHAPLIMYHGARPFCGAGRAYENWTLAVELRPDPDKEQQPVSNRRILERVRPLIEGLRTPSVVGAGGGDLVQDRLRRLEIDECVFLPVTGLPRRDLAPYDEQSFAAHRDAAVEEGGETRRHFLRIRVGGWEEELVTTVFVRVHTQGGMLMLEIAPHVLLPVRADFADADRITHQYQHNSLFGKTAWVAARTPRSIGFALATLWHGGALSWRIVTGGYGRAMPDGPAYSVRELGSYGSSSLFQDMDVDRYLKAVQDRVANGVRQALVEAGYRTDEFAQKIVNVSDGGVLIQNSRGAFAIGDGNVATADGAPRPPQQRTNSGGDADDSA